MLRLVGKNILIGALYTILVFQVGTTHSLDDKIKQCQSKFIEQIKKVQVTRPPRCFDSTKLTQVKDYSQIYVNYFKTLPPECKQPTSYDFTKCINYSFKYFQDHSKEIQTSLTESIKALLQGSQSCIDLALKEFNNLDDYLAKGCT